MKLMKISGIIGFILLAISVIFFGQLIYTVLSTSSQDTTFGDINQDDSDGGFQYLSIGSLLLYLILSIFFFLGFAKMGKMTENKLLKITSWIMTVLIILLLLTGLILASFSTVSTDDTPQQNDFGPGFQGPGIPDSLKIVLSFLTLFIFIALFVLIVTFLFYIGLVEVGEKVKYARLSGILGILTTGCIPFLSLVLSFLPLLFIILIFSGAEISETQIKIVSTLTALLISFLWWVLLIFMSVSLLDASKKFEGSKDLVSDKQQTQNTKHPESQ